MPLTSNLLSGDDRLEACLVQDSAHITVVTRGDFVAKVQIALNMIMGTSLDTDGVYGQGTAAVVEQFKTARNILGPGQTVPDNIVGKLTIAALDVEVAALERIAPEPTPLRIVVLSPPQHGGSVSSGGPVRLGFAIPGGLANVGSVNAPAFPPVPSPILPPSQVMRVAARATATIRILGGGQGAQVFCQNQPAGQPVLQGTNGKVAWLFKAPSVDRIAPDPVGPTISATNLADGNNLVTGSDPEDFSIDGFFVGDAIVFAVNQQGQFQSMLVQVRANAGSFANRPPLKNFKPKSSFFSAETTDPGAEFEPHGVSGGRPVGSIVRKGGRLINFGGESETPEFEDYQTSVSQSPYIRANINNGKIVFRPLWDDPDPNAGLPAGSASHITMRGTPLKFFVKAINHVARKGNCLFTFSGDKGDLQLASTMGRVVERDGDNIALEL